MSRTVVVWFRNDLRVSDHACLYEASRRADRVLPIYCFDPRHFALTALGFPKTGSYRAAFLLESVADLRRSLRARGSDLIVRVGRPEVEVARLAATHQAEAVLFHHEPFPEEQEVVRALQGKLDGVALTGFWGSTLFHRDDLPFAPEHVPDVFTKFRRKVEKKSKPRPTLPAPGRLPALESAIDPGEIPSLERLGLVERTVDRRRALAFVGGETAARERMDSWIWQRNCLRQYKKTRNGLIGADYSSKLSPWLSVGAVSARTVAEEIARYEEQRTRNESTYWLLFELLWRDYFHFIAVRYGSRLFQLRGPKGPPDATWRREREEFEAWCEGRTGIPFVDANMRELRLTGFMSNRGRQNVASFLTKNLEIDWRWGASWFESQLVDYDPGSNWGNWAYVAGVGNDPRDRFFHIENQADRYDPEGAYVRTWVPELAPLAGGAIHTAHRLAEHELVRAGVAGHAYPPPILDMDASYRKLRRRAA